jgi:hypothetical protein
MRACRTTPRFIAGRLEYSTTNHIDVIKPRAATRLVTRAELHRKRLSRSPEQSVGTDVGSAHHAPSPMVFTVVDVLEIVTEFLPSLTDWLACRCVSSWWHAAVGNTVKQLNDQCDVDLSNACFQRRLLRHLHGSTKAVWRLALMCFGSKLRVLMRPRGFPLSTKDLVSRLPYLQTLEITAHDTDLHFVAKLRHLRRLSLAGSGKNIRSISALCGTTITDLDVSRTTVDDASLIAFVRLQAVPLTSLNVAGSTVTDRAMVEVAEWCSELRRIDVRFSDCSDVSLAPIAKGNPHLEEFVAGDTYWTQPPLTRVTFDALALNCRTLRKAALRKAQRVHLADITLLVERCTELEMLDLHNNADLANDEVLLLVARCCPRLRMMDVSLSDRFATTSRITDVGVTELARGCPLLTSLGLIRARQVTDIGMFEVAKHCTLLRSLRAERTSITAKSVEALRQNCPLLSYFTHPRDVIR